MHDRAPGFTTEKVAQYDPDTDRLVFRWAVIDEAEERIARFETEAEAKADASRRNGMRCSHELVAIRHRTLGPGGGAFCARCGASIKPKASGAG